MKNLLIIWCFILLIFNFISCKKEEIIDPCILNPLTNNATIKRIIYLEEKHNIDSCSINLVSRIDVQTKLKDYFFVVTNGSPVLKYHFIKNAQIINCSGRDIGEFYNEDNYKEFFASVKFEKNIWKKNKNAPKENTGTCGTLDPIKDLPDFQKLKIQIDKYAWKSAIYQYKYKNATLYYGLYTPIDQIGKKYAKTAAMDCKATNFQDLETWSQADFLENAILERQVL
jgi:hypothetical protein